MKTITLQDLSGSPEELESLLSMMHQRKTELSGEIAQNVQLSRMQAPLPCWFAYADAEIHYCTVVEIWIRAAQGWGGPAASQALHSPDAGKDA